MADSKAKIDEVAVDAPAHTVTTETPAKADTTSNPIPNDAKADQPPVRAARPDTPIAASLAAGAGAHEGRVLDHRVGDIEVDENGIDADGRFQGDPSKK